MYAVLVESVESGVEVLQLCQTAACAVSARYVLHKSYIIKTVFVGNFEYSLVIIMTM